MDQNSDAGARFAPPTARIDDPSPPLGELPLAQRGARFIAALIDTAIALGVIWVASLLTPWNIFSPTTGHGFGTMLGNQVIGFLLFMLVQGWLLVKHGQTIGKRLLRIRVVRPDGAHVDPVRMLALRYGSGFFLTAIPVVGLLYALVDSLMIFREPRRCLHDLIADTIVVRT